MINHICYLSLFRVKSILCVCRLRISRDLVQPVILCHLELFRVVSLYMCIPMSPSLQVSLQYTGWHDVKGSEPRYAGSTGAIQTIAMQLKQITNASSGK